MLSDELKKILEDKCDLTVQDKVVNNDQLKHWKLAGIIDCGKYQIEKSGALLLCNNSVKVILEPGNTMWIEKFRLALISSNIFEEIIVLIDPTESDLYALTNYEDIISLLESEFIGKFIETMKPSLYYKDSNGNDYKIYSSDIWSSPYLSATPCYDYCDVSISTGDSFTDNPIITTTVTGNLTSYKFNKI